MHVVHSVGYRIALVLGWHTLHLKLSFNQVIVAMKLSLQGNLKAKYSIMKNNTLNNYIIQD